MQELELTNDILQKDIEDFVDKICPIDDVENDLPLIEKYKDSVHQGVDNLAVMVMVVERIGKKPVALRKVARMGKKDALHMLQALMEHFK